MIVLKFKALLQWFTDRDDEDGQGKAGDQPGGHIREVEISLEELADMLGEVLQLPRIEPKGKDAIRSKKDRYNTIRQSGPDSLRHFKRTYKRALKRQVSMDNYDPANPVIIPMREDERFRSWKTVSEPEANAAVIYMMDVSGSMTAPVRRFLNLVRVNADPLPGFTN